MSTATKERQSVLSPCPSCASEKIYTVGYRGEWWCECRLCGERTARHSSAGAAVRAWEDLVAIKRETNAAFAARGQAARVEAQ